MNIEHRQSNFAQFSDELWLEAEHDGTRINFDLAQSEMMGFAFNMIDIALDCVRKCEMDVPESIDDRLCEVLNWINELN